MSGSAADQLYDNRKMRSLIKALILVSLYIRCAFNELIYKYPFD